MDKFKSMRADCAEARGGMIAKRAKMKRRHGGSVEGREPKERRDKLAHGGKAEHKGKGHVSVNVIVPPAQQQAHPMPIPVPARPPVPPVGLGGPPPGGMPPGAGMMPPPGAPRPPMPPGPPRPGFKRGGAPKMTAGAGSGLGRLEKTALAKEEERRSE